MSHRTIRRLLAVAAITMTSSAVAGAQGWNHPSFQTPTAAPREFNFALSDGGVAGTTFLFQWREGMAAGSQLNFDVGFADPDFGDDKIVLGAGFGHELVRSRPDLPLDILFTAGLYGAVGGNSPFFRVPAGVSVGHVFPLEGGFAITPFAHPRISFDYCGECGVNGDSETELSLNFDLGVDFRVTPNLSLRASGMFGGSDLLGDDDAFGISLAWAPRALRR